MCIIHAIANAQKGIKLQVALALMCMCVSAYMQVGLCVQRVALKDQTCLLVPCCCVLLLCLAINISYFKIMIMMAMNGQHPLAAEPLPVQINCLLKSLTLNKRLFCSTQTGFKMNHVIQVL